MDLPAANSASSRPAQAPVQPQATPLSSHIQQIADTPQSRGGSYEISGSRSASLPATSPQPARQRSIEIANTSDEGKDALVMTVKEAVPRAQRFWQSGTHNALKQGGNELVIRLPPSALDHSHLRSWTSTKIGTRTTGMFPELPSRRKHALFLDLPAEIRNRVYFYLLDDHEVSITIVRTGARFARIAPISSDILVTRRSLRIELKQYLRIHGLATNATFCVAGAHTLDRPLLFVPANDRLLLRIVSVRSTMDAVTRGQGLDRYLHRFPSLHRIEIDLGSQDLSERWWWVPQEVKARLNILRAKSQCRNGVFIRKRFRLRHLAKIHPSIVPPIGSFNGAGVNRRILVTEVCTADGPTCCVLKVAGFQILCSMSGICAPGGPQEGCLVASTRRQYHHTTTTSLCALKFSMGTWDRIWRRRPNIV